MSQALTRLKKGAYHGENDCDSDTVSHTAHTHSCISYTQATKHQREDFSVITSRHRLACSYVAF